jgi:4-alpha-glucanotransferase
MAFTRASGLLLHPTSLPGRYGVGDLGEWAYRFVDYLVEAKQSLWQVLPLGPTSYGDSPYQALSSFAGNTLLISLDLLVDDGYLTADDLADVPNFQAAHVDYGTVIDYHNLMLAKAYERFKANPGKGERSFRAFRVGNRAWLDDFALFMTLKTLHEGRPWVEWESDLALHKPDAIAAAHHQHAEIVEQYAFRQWLFFKQWFALKSYANNMGVRFIGDAPIFVAHDSSDVWGNQKLFSLDARGNPTVIAGVPPDYFSADGQRWGNPHYRWDIMAKDGYTWWIARLRAILSMVDILRIDHFRGFDAYWEVAATEPTARNGRWVKGPGSAFFNVINAALGGLPIIAEDLGVITPEVEAMRDGAGLPGMKVLQFAWGGRGGENSFLPFNHVPNCIVYTGTHDNNTTVGWWNNPHEATDEMKAHITRYVGADITEPHWAMIRIAQASVAHTAIVPMQDLLGLDEHSRMNTPGRESGNWGWRMTEADFDNPAKARLADLTTLYGRAPGAKKPIVDES